MRQQATRDLHAYWTGLRGDRAAPERGDVDPAAIRAVLPDTFMLQVGEASAFPVLLSGARCNAMFGAGLRGRDFVELFAPRDRVQVAGLCANVCDGAVPVVAGVRGAPEGEPAADFELLLLPLRHNGKTHARILGILAPAGRPAWLGLQPLRELSLVSMRMVMSPPAARGEGPAGSDRRRRAEGRARLTLIQGGRAGQPGAGARAGGVMAP